MAFRSESRSICPLQNGSLCDRARISAQSHRASLRDISVLIRHEIYDLMRAVLCEFTGIRIRDTQYVSGKFDDGDLHSKTNAKVRDLVSPRILRSSDLALNATVSKTTRHQDPGYVRKV